MARSGTTSWRQLQHSAHVTSQAHLHRLHDSGHLAGAAASHVGREHVGLHLARLGAVRPEELGVEGNGLLAVAQAVLDLRWGGRRKERDSRN